MYWCNLGKHNVVSGSIPGLVKCCGYWNFHYDECCKANKENKE